MHDGLNPAEGICLETMQYAVNTQSLSRLYVRLLGLLLITGLIDGLMLRMLGLSFLSPALSATDSLETNG